jgi:hypothetical protein
MVQIEILIKEEESSTRIVIHGNIIAGISVTSEHLADHMTSSLRWPVVLHTCLLINHIRVTKAPPPSLDPTLSLSG